MKIDYKNYNSLLEWISQSSSQISQEISITNVRIEITVKRMRLKNIDVFCDCLFSSQASSIYNLQNMNVRDGVEMEQLTVE